MLPEHSKFTRCLSLHCESRSPYSPRDPHYPCPACTDSFRETRRFSCDLIFKLLCRDCLTRQYKNGHQPEGLFGAEKKGNGRRGTRQYASLGGRRGDPPVAILLVSHFSRGIACAYAPPGSIFKMRIGCQSLAGPGSSGDIGKLEASLSHHTEHTCGSKICPPEANGQKKPSQELGGILRVVT